MIRFNNRFERLTRLKSDLPGGIGLPQFAALTIGSSIITLERPAFQIDFQQKNNVRMERKKSC
jgi:hypothetical protein